jgi:hypothetical protein
VAPSREVRAAEAPDDADHHHRRQDGAAAGRPDGQQGEYGAAVGEGERHAHRQQPGDVAAAVQALALRLGPLALVQPLLVSGLFLSGWRPP